METKNQSLNECEIKFADDGWLFEGYASKFGGVDSYNDTVQKGAYEKTLSKRAKPVFMRLEHKSGALPPGKWHSVIEDDIGLFVAGELTKGQTQAADIRASMKHGTLDGLSIGYRIPKGGAEEKDGIRHLKEIELIEISIVQNPADSGAIITGIKADIETIESLKEAERFLRDVDTFSVSTAKAFVSRVKSLAARDAQQTYEDEINELKARIETDHAGDRLSEFIKSL